MHILKLPWFGHNGDGKLIECYSVSVNSDGSRLASGGLDGNVKIWDTNTIQQFKSVEGIDQSKADFDRLLPPKSHRRAMCSVSRHNGVVTSVKFSPNGRFLASGSDDKIVLIWEKDDLMANRPKQFGEVEADLEHWTVRKRLVAHENDIQDICWSPDGSLLVTVGLDRLIIIWSGTTFERIKRYDIHQSMVKGIVFDPANKFFATASDDRTVRIFRYSKKLHELVNDYEFQMEHVVFDPFAKSPLTSYFRRMSWSPDGQNIAVPNATNGPVTSVAIIKRGNWSTDISLIGHEAPCEVCSFSPRLFSLEEDPNKQDGKFHTVLATGGQDSTLVIWSTAQSKPLVVAKDICASSITDICWSPDGETLYCSCLDGSIVCVSFDKYELGLVVNEEMVEAQLHKYGRDRKSNVFPESIDQLFLEEKAEKVIKKQETPVPDTPQPASPAPVTPGPSSRAVSATPVKLNQTVTMKNGKKRVAPTLVSGPTRAPAIPAVKITKRLKTNSKLSQSSYLLPRSGLATAVTGAKERKEATLNGEELKEDQDNDNLDIAVDLPGNQPNISVSTLKKQKTKVKKQIMEAKYPSHFKLISNMSQSLFNHTSLMQHEMSKIMHPSDLAQTDELFSGTSASADTHDEDLIFAVLVTGVDHHDNPDYALEAEPRKIHTTLEVRNGPSWEDDGDEIDLDDKDKIDFQDPTVVIVTSNVDKTKRKYVIYFPYKIQHALPIVIKGILVYFVLVSFDGTMQIVFAESGTLVCPSLELGINLVCLKHSNLYLLGVTSSGLVYVWKVPEPPKERHLKGILNGVSLAPVMNIDLVVDAQKKVISPHVKLIEVDPSTGEPYVMIDDTNDVYKYSSDLGCWTKVIDTWYYHVLTNSKIENSNKLLEYFYHMSFNGFNEEIQRYKRGKYLFDSSTTELESVMTQRFNEMMH